MLTAAAAQERAEYEDAQREMEREKAEYEAAQRKADKERREATDARKRVEERRALHSIAQALLQFYLLCFVYFSFSCFTTRASGQRSARRWIQSRRCQFSQFSCITTTKKYHQ